MHVGLPLLPFVDRSCTIISYTFYQLSLPPSSIVGTWCHAAAKNVRCSGLNPTSAGSESLSLPFLLPQQVHRRKVV